MFVNQSTGILFLVSTPIGNLEDLSPRAKTTLSSVSYILCESPEQSRKLGVSASLIRYEGKGFKAEVQKTRVLEDLRIGKSVALVSNAGTPLISDPGLSLVQAVVHQGFPVIHIPGPAAFVSAVATSGLPTKNILFIGFLPKKTAAIEKKFERVKSTLMALDDPVSLVCYVSKYQLWKTLDAVKEIYGDSVMVNVARELTKLYEEHKTGSIADIQQWLSKSKNREKGEFTLTLTMRQNND